MRERLGGNGRVYIVAYRVQRPAVRALCCCWHPLCIGLSDYACFTHMKFMEICKHILTVLFHMGGSSLQQR